MDTENRSRTRLTDLAAYLVAASSLTLGPSAHANKQPEPKAQLRSAARIALSAIYTAEKAYYAETESYTTDLESAGYAPEDEGPYDCGFAGDHPDLPDYARAERETFTAACVGNLDSDPVLDLWTIDEAKRLVHVVAD